MGTTGRKAVWGAALALWVMIPAASAAASGSGKTDAALQGSSGSPQPVIVRYNPAAKDRVKNLLPRRGRGPVEHNLIAAFSVVMDASEIAAVSSDPDVLSISADAKVTPTASASASGTASPLKKSLGLITDAYTGAGVTVAVIDSGIQNIGDLSGRIVAAYDFTSESGAAPTTPVDPYGHGTHVAGLIGSSGASSSGKYAGVATAVKLVSLRVLDENGVGRSTSVLQALEFAVANKDRFGIKVVNLSLGHPIFESVTTDPLVGAVEAAVRTGLIVVTAAGNFGTNPDTGVVGYGGITSPGNAPSAITVGAANGAGTDGRRDDRVAGFSSRGPTWYNGLAKPDVVAPGTNLVSSNVDGSTLAGLYPSRVVREGGAKFLKLSGSSMAAAVVSGLAAVMIEANTSGAYQRWQEVQSQLKKPTRTSYPGAPSLHAGALKAQLQFSATPLRDGSGAFYDALTQGTGEVNGAGAVLLAYSTDTTKPVREYWLTTATSLSSPFAGIEEPWSQAITWGTRLVAGSSIVEVNQAAWRSDVVWGAGQLDNLVWGTVTGDDNLVWGTAIGWDDNIVWGTALFSGNTTLMDDIVGTTGMSWDDNIVWGTGLLGAYVGDGVVWGAAATAGDNLVWGTLSNDNLVWGTLSDDNLVWGTASNSPGGGNGGGL